MKNKTADGGVRACVLLPDAVHLLNGHYLQLCNIKTSDMSPKIKHLILEESARHL